MTHEEIAKALENMIREDGKRPPEEQIRDLIEAGVIDEHGQILVGRGESKDGPRTSERNGPADAPSSRKAGET